MADVLKYGWSHGGKMGHEMKCASNLAFNRLGGAFVKMDSAGCVTLVTASTDNIIGWAEVPRPSNAIYDYWTSSTTEGKDFVHVITDPNAIFAMPVLENEASLTATSHAGKFVAASAAGSGTTLKQWVRGKTVVASANMQLFVVDVDLDNRIAYVRINPHHLA